jgi:hypothetical protein
MVMTEGVVARRTCHRPSTAEDVSSVSADPLIGLANDTVTVLTVGHVGGTEQRLAIEALFEVVCAKNRTTGVTLISVS